MSENIKTILHIKMKDHSDNEMEKLRKNASTKLVLKDT